MKHLSSMMLFILAIAISGFAQEKQSVKATEFGMLPTPTVVPSIAKQIANGTIQLADPNMDPLPGHPKRRGVNNVVPGKGLPVNGDALVANQERAVKKQGREALLVFDANTSPYTPSDPTGAVGPNHFVGAWNTGFRVFDKEGNPLTSAMSLSTLFPGNNAGDPIVLYDVEADRFVITEFDHSPNGLNIAICQGPDPVNDDWHVYTSGLGTGAFPDYPKFSIWSDGYYITANINSSNRIFIMERDKMLVGDDAQFVLLPMPGLAKNGFYSPQFFNTTDGNLPPVGEPAYVVYMQDDAWSGVSEDHLKIWSVTADWEDISNSEISTAVQIPTTPFVSVFDGGSFSNRPQPSGPQQDVLQATVMNQAQYRRFADHNSAIFNFVVDVESSGEKAGIRWYEMRQTADGEPWEIYQEGTFVSPNNNKDAFSGSMAMDGQGNIGMGYTTVSSTEKIAIYFTGRYASDPVGQMTIDESLIAQSTANNPSNRLADYVHLTLDPSDDKTFWHIAEYFNGGRKDVVGAFKIAPDFQNDIGVASVDQPEDGLLTDSELITITVFNAGEAEQANFEVNYQIDGGDIITEIFTATIAPQGYESFTFAQTTDMSTIGQTYEIMAFTSLADDEDPSNDAVIKEVTHYGPTDLGVTMINTPMTGENLSSDEQVSISIKNFGTEEQSDFDVSYDADGMVVSEVVSGPLAFGETLDYTFTSPADLSDLGMHYMKAYTSLSGDTDMNNDTTHKLVVNSNCIPMANCANDHEIARIQLGTIDNESGCSENGYGDFVNQMTDLVRNTSHELIMSASYGDQFVKVWIDFNDDFVYDADEVVAAFEMADGQGSGDYTQTEELIIPQNANLGEHLMRVKLSWIVPIGDDQACNDIPEGGETEDYMVNVLSYVGIESMPLQEAEMIVANMGNNQFRVSMNSAETTEPLRIDVHNTMGQCLLHNRVIKTNDRYTYDIDMSYAKPGLYIIRFGTDEYGKVRKILVK
ncbi:MULTISPECIES: GEVED domain-containing protein [unclassified Lentimicrobium]|uniref:GEVED domain-containing protein n=1 Tax=unclassified Lentimicrobium TaxID=2677434 RepID=UPI0015548FAE|nr:MULTISPECIES: GEVED domain-containing protein [unclassified Lentimicrobium]NPD44753.1 hypothetical protein [Lentimicrobium sp. S6]NPD83391.1 hypothetical protein [Lentimicrobium sp. L6]